MLSRQNSPSYRPARMNCSPLCSCTKHLGEDGSDEGIRAPGSGCRGYRLKRVGDSSTSNIEIEVEGGEDTVVHLKGRIDVDSSPDVRDRLRTILFKDPVPHSVSADLAGVTSIEASGIATLVESLKVA